MATITTHYKGNMLFETQIGNHTLTIDVPAEMGGSDRGPQPPQLFIASLGSCIGAFVAQYAERAGIDASSMTVDINFEKAADPTRLVKLRAVVKLPNADCSKRIDAMKKVAEHCPVHATIRTMEELEIDILGEGDCHIEA
jgi:putative redox protein